MQINTKTGRVTLNQTEQRQLSGAFAVMKHLAPHSNDAEAILDRMGAVVIEFVSTRVRNEDLSDEVNVLDPEFEVKEDIDEEEVVVAGTA